MPDIATDVRWGTRNTKLATALLVCGFQLSDQPFTTDVESNGSITNIWFKPGARLDDGTMINASQIETEWLAVDGNKWPEVRWIREALNARDWLLKKVVYGKLFPTSGSVDSAWYLTDDIKLAAALVGCMHKLLHYKDRKFYFNQGVRDDVVVYQRNEGRERMQWSKKAILQQDILMQAIKGPRNHPMANIHHNKRLLRMPVNASAELQRALLRELHEPI